MPKRGRALTESRHGLKRRLLWLALRRLIDYNEFKEVDWVNIKEIKEGLAATRFEDLPDRLAVLEGDSRAGVKKLVEYYKKWYNKVLDERRRLQGLLYFERKYKEFGLICGVDEAGAGPLAGPVAAGAVILPVDCVIEGLDDSKKLSPKKRQELSEIIRERAVAYAVVFVDNDEIDEINILQARLKAMALAVDALEMQPGFVLFDGNKSPLIKIPHAAVTDGDSKSMSIAAASVLAKVERDGLMDEYHEIYPEYGFDRHKGYGTAQHIEAIRRHGATPIHRQSFIRNLGW